MQARENNAILLSMCSARKSNLASWPRTLYSRYCYCYCYCSFCDCDFFKFKSFSDYEPIRSSETRAKSHQQLRAVEVEAVLVARQRPVERQASKLAAGQVSLRSESNNGFFQP